MPHPLFARRRPIVERVRLEEHAGEARRPGSGRVFLPVLVNRVSMASERAAVRSGYALLRSV
jgi:hypothetical protein